MEKIPSFSVDHTILQKGMYISRIDQPDIVTYDIRMKRPNRGDYFSTGGMHTFEHLFATFARNSEWKQHVIYVGPMGCRTGFYLITKGLSHKNAIDLVRQSMAYIAGFAGEIPGASAVECGNFEDQDLEQAKQVARDIQAVLEAWQEETLHY